MEQQTKSLLGSIGGALGTVPGMALAGTGVSMLASLLNPPRKPKVGMINPEQFRDDIVLDGGDLARIRSAGLDSAATGNIANVSAIKQMGAGSRLSKGAILSALAGSSYGIGKAATEGEAGLAGMKRQSMLDFMGEKQKYAAATAAAYNDYNDTRAGWVNSMTQAPIGLMSKALMLWRYGKDNAAGGGAGGQNA